ncbi:MAG: hypothetical protein AAGC55_07285, partial [Myxococcota bacterium]
AAVFALTLALLRDAQVGPLSAGERAVAHALGFFGIGNAPFHLTLAVLLSTSAITACALDLIATLHLGPAYPRWFPINVLASGLGVGLLCARAMAGSEPARSEAQPIEQYSHRM